MLAKWGNLFLNVTFNVANGTIVLDIGASCDDSSPCTIDNASCDLDSICTCNLDYISDEGTKCIPCKYISSVAYKSLFIYISIFHSCRWHRRWMWKGCPVWPYRQHRMHWWFVLLCWKFFRIQRNMLRVERFVLCFFFLAIYTANMKEKVVKPRVVIVVSITLYSMVQNSMY